MNKYASVLQLKTLYFPTYKLDLKRPGFIEEVNYNFKIDYAVNEVNDYKVEVTVAVTDRLNSLKLELTACGIFRIDDSLLNGIDKEIILRRNTVAIMFPYIRSQITLLTTQPGMNAVIMPPINVNALIDDMEANAKI